MLSNTAKLYFPKLVFEKAIQLENSNKQISVYKLDWTRKESKCSNADDNAKTELLSECDSRVKSLLFAIPDSYIKEIRRLSWQSVAEWNSIRLLDDSIKKIYLMPAASIIETSFTLLVDCLYDSSTQYYYRKNDKDFLLIMLLYKFWKNQTKSSLILKFSKISQLMDIARTHPDLQLEIAKFLEFTKYDLKVESNGIE